LKKKSIVSFASLLLLFSLFIGGSISHVFASGMDYEIENQQKSKQVILETTTDTIPEKVIFHETNDGYAGYLGRDSYYYDFDAGLYFAVYKGSVYDRPPYPLPAAVFLKE